MAAEVLSKRDAELYIVTVLTLQLLFAVYSKADGACNSLLGSLSPNKSTVLLLPLVLCATPYCLCMCVFVFSV